MTTQTPHVLLLLLVAHSVFAAPLPPVPNYVSECNTVRQLHSNSSFVSVMNECIAPNSKSSIPLDIVHQIQEWLQVRMSARLTASTVIISLNFAAQGRLYMQYCLLVLLAFPLIVSSHQDAMQLEVLARCLPFFSHRPLTPLTASRTFVSRWHSSSFALPLPLRCLRSCSSHSSSPPPASASLSVRIH